MFDNSEEFIAAFDAAVEAAARNIAEDGEAIMLNALLIERSLVQEKLLKAGDPSNFASIYNLTKIALTDTVNLAAASLPRGTFDRQKFRPEISRAIGQSVLNIVRGTLLQHDDERRNANTFARLP